MIVNNVNAYNQLTLSCDAPERPNKSTVILDSAVSVTCMRIEANCSRAKVQEPSLSPGTPSNVPIHTKETLELPMKKLSQAAKRAYRVNEIRGGTELFKIVFIGKVKVLRRNKSVCFFDFPQTVFHLPPTSPILL